MINDLEIQITVLSGVSAGDKFTFNLQRAKATVVGRAVECELVLQDQTVSRKHAQFELRDNGVYISDLGSSQGTFHMGFRLIPGIDDARRLSSSDEFKIGQTLFRIHFNENAFPRTQQLDVVDPNATISRKQKKSLLSKYFRTPLSKVAAVLALIAVLGVLLIDDGGKGLPKQLSEEKLKLPQHRVLGYWPVGKTKLDKDLTHVDKAQFELMPNDLLIEYSYRSEVPIAVKLGDALIEEIEPYTFGWQRRELIVRDVLAGSGQTLIFDNLTFPRKKGEKPGKAKYWAIRSTRMTPLSRATPPSVETKLEASIAAVSRLDKSADGLFTLVRASQEALLEMLIEDSVDGSGFGISMEARSLDASELVATLQGIVQERRGPRDTAVSARHVAAMRQLVSFLDAELWRRVNSRLQQARRCAKSKDYICAHDNLLSVLKMFPAEDDYRWMLASRMFEDKKIVPKRVKANPERYREKKYR